MFNYEFSIKTRLIFGRGTVERVGDEVAKMGSKKCMIHYDGGAYIEPLIEQVKKSLTDAGVDYIELPGVQPNPKFSLIHKGIDLCKSEGIDFILAVGGGSTMDSAKVIAGGVRFRGDVWNELNMGAKEVDVLKHAAITTLAGTGSEFSAVAMVQNDEIEPQIKKGIAYPGSNFDFVIANPELLYTLPAKQTAAGTFDIISHSMESYFSDTPNAFLLNGVLETVIKTALKEGKVCLEHPDDYDARANLLMCSYIATSGLHMCGVETDWTVHNIEKPLTNIYHGTHGINLAILTLAWLRYSHGRDIPKFEQWAVNCMGATRDIYDPEKTINDGIDALENWIKKMGMPTRLSEIGIGSDRFEEAAELALAVAGFKGREGYIGRVTKLTFDQIIDVYNLAL